MKVLYDKYYETENLFGKPYPELIEFFTNYPERGRVLDLGCGQGRDAIPVTRLGFEVTAIDNSQVGIKQMNQIAKKEDLKLEGQVADIFEYNDFGDYDFVLLDSMFHFEKKDKIKETSFIKKILSSIKKGCLLIICLQDTGNKVEILNETLDSEKQRERVTDIKFNYVFEDSESGHGSESKYRMIVVMK